MEVVFLKAKQRLIKEITLKGTTPYPLIKKVTSYHYKIDKTQEGFNKFFKHIQKHAAQGACMYKGLLKRKIKNESRAFLTDRIAQTELLVLDLDGIEFPLVNKSTLNNHDIQTISEQFIAYLPPEFHDISYVAQASASLGLKGNKVSMHLFFLLTHPIAPTVLKEWLKTLNYEIEFLANQLKLSANGQSLSYPLDVSLAENSKLIYIGAPKFVGVQDPINTGDRLCVVNRGSPTVDISNLVKDVNPEKVHHIGLQIKNGLRKKAGLSKKNEKVTTINVNNEAQEVLQNPDRMTIEICRVSEPYVNCNINGGDSGAYYFVLTNPHYMYNFKGEPIFEIEKADPEFYKSIFETYKEEISAGKNVLPIILRDFYTDVYYNGVFDEDKQQFTDDYPLTPTQKGSLDGFMRTHNRPSPDFVPDAKVVFDPNTEKGINLKDSPYYVNLYRKTPYMLEASKDVEVLTYGEAIKLQRYIPNIYNLIKHIVGDGDTEVEHFVNWLAYIYKNKRKTMTAWIFTGVPGTGKGLFVHKILKPLFGEQQVPMRALENIEEQFNLYMRTALFLVIDEFRMAASGSIGKMADKLKHQITEPNLTIRAMRTNQIELPSFCNFIFLTNRADAVKIEEGDRRYNVGPRQEHKIEEKYPELLNNFEILEQELYTFAGFLHSFQVDVRMAHTALENKAKQEMKQVSMSVLEEFANAIKTNHLEYFVDILDIPLTNTFDAGSISTAQRYIKNWITQTDKEIIIPMQHFKIVYDVLTDNTNSLSNRAFIKAMNRLNIKTTRKRIGAERTSSAPRGVLIIWLLEEDVKQSLLDTHFDEKDIQLVNKGLH